MVRVHSSALPYNMYIIQSYPEQHNTLKKIYSYVQYL